jgi:DNA-directed RNA polymerase subunit RPC12/RpoP
MKGKNKKDKAEKGQPDKVYTDEPAFDIVYFDDDEPEVFIDYVCIDCGCIDPVPEFVVGECAYDLEPGELPEFICPECDGTLVRKQKPTDEDTAG